MTMKLHILTFSPQCRKVMALASYLDSPVEVVLKEAGKFQQDPAYLALNPNGKVPVLEDGNESVWESNIILRYLAEKAGRDLWPKDAAAQREITKWQFWEASHLAPALLGVYFQRVIKKVLNLGEPDQALIEEKLGFSERFLKILDGELGKHDYVVGNQLSIADFSVGAIVETTSLSGIDISGYQHVQSWLERMCKLKGWGEIVPAEETNMPMAA